jgi:Sel1 repeat-containing protein
LKNKSLYTEILEADTLSHYQLLGLKLFENDVAIIHKAGLTQTRKLKAWDLHENVEIAKQIVEMHFQVSSAIAKLENLEQKKIYDIELAEKLGIPIPEIPDKKTVTNHNSRKFPGDSVEKSCKYNLKCPICFESVHITAEANLKKLICPHCEERIQVIGKGNTASDILTLQAVPASTPVSSKAIVILVASLTLLLIGVLIVPIFNKKNTYSITNSNSIRPPETIVKNRSFENKEPVKVTPKKQSASKKNQLFENQERKKSAFEKKQKPVESFDPKKVNIKKLLEEYLPLAVNGNKVARYICYNAYRIQNNYTSMYQYKPLKLHLTDISSVLKDEKELFTEILSKAKLGNSFFQVIAGGCYAIGYGIKRDKIKASYWYSQSAENKNILGIFLTGMTLCATNKDSKKGVFLIKKAAEAGLGDAQKEIGIIYMMGHYGIPVDLGYAEKNLLGAIEKGNKSAKIPYDAFLLIVHKHGYKSKNNQPEEN